MHVDLSPERLTFPGRGVEQSSLGQCMECGFCTIRCPTFVLLRHEGDSPRGRIRLARQILEQGEHPTREAIDHLDRCLSCLSCTSSCPFGVDHSALWDAARAAMETRKVRPLSERLWRRTLARVLTSPRLFSIALSTAFAGRILRPVLPRTLRRMIDQAPRIIPDRGPTAQARVYPAEGERRKRVALLAGCVQQVLGASIDAATIRVLTRHGYEVVIAEGGGCCGAVSLHLGFEHAAREHAKANVAAWLRIADSEGLDAIVINASGCGSTVKDYGRILADDPQWAEAAHRIASMTMDVTELLSESPLRLTGEPDGMHVAMHLPCSMQHGQGISIIPRRLLEEAGFKVSLAPESHMCCGAAGTYNLTQPDISDRLGRRKAQALGATHARVAATANMGCMLHIRRFDVLPVVHIVELIDWATGGEIPAQLRSAMVTS